jgi:hypothetical protein
MTKAIQTKLFNFLKKDQAFLDIYKMALQEQIDKSKAILRDLVLDAYKVKDPKTIKALFQTQLKYMIDSMAYEIDETNKKSLLDNYILNGADLGCSWVRIDSIYFDLDMIYLDFKSYCYG